MNESQLPAAACPEDVLLQAFAAGVTAVEQAAPILAHLETCDHCQSTVEQLSRHDETCRLAVPLEPAVAELLLEPAFREADARLESLSHSQERSANAVGEPAHAGMILGRYRLLETIGSGGMGTVFKAMHVDLNKIVAVKLLPARSGSHPTSVERFRREIQALGRVEHPNVVTAYDAGEEHGQWYLAMEHLRGVNLSALLKQHGPFAPADACELARQAAVGLAHIHGMGLVHRDVKPSNLLLTPEGIVKVLDMGLALFADPAAADAELTGTGLAVGTSAYMSPEQRRDSHGIDHRSDLYSLGATLFALLTGRAPAADIGALLAGERGFAVLELLSAASPARRPPTPPDLPAVLARLLSAEPDQRYQSAGEAAEALAPFASGSNVVPLASESRGSIEFRRDETACVSSAADGRRSTPRADSIRRRSLARSAALIFGVFALFAGVVIVIRFVSDSRHEASGGSRAQDSTIEPRNPGPAGQWTIERNVAEWALHRGGRVKPHYSPWVAKPADLPKQVLLIQSIDFYGLSRLQSADLTTLRDLTALQYLQIHRTAVTDEGLAHLVPIRSLLWLQLDNTQITDNGLKHLARLEKLQMLTLNGTAITDTGLLQLAPLMHLVYLDLSETRITGAGLAALQPLKSLRTLLLRGTSVGDDGLGALGKLPSLKKLNLEGTPITDEAADALAALTGLAELDVRDTALTPAARMRLRTALPGCKIVE